MSVELRINITSNAPNTPYGGLLNITTTSVTQYELTGFMADYEYNITVRGVNCRNQEGRESDPQNLDKHQQDLQQEILFFPSGYHLKIVHAHLLFFLSWIATNNWYTWSHCLWRWDGISGEQLGKASSSLYRNVISVLLALIYSLWFVIINDKNLNFCYCSCLCLHGQLCPGRDQLVA